MLPSGVPSFPIVFNFFLIFFFFFFVFWPVSVQREQAGTGGHSLNAVVSEYQQGYKRPAVFRQSIVMQAGLWQVRGNTQPASQPVSYPWYTWAL